MGGSIPRAVYTTGGRVVIMIPDRFSHLVGGMSVIGRPPYERMGNEIQFGDLPEDCQRLVLDVYRELWDLPREPLAAPGARTAAEA